ncbi:MAG TPA: pyruvate kinase [Oscillatoriaceae cyanobacterium M33_DOE_052]|uniref:Pyruvate kinase n=1 Tax=Planktothricoides sp. SpSt-374 TaxID=2282167 RepID=A0A7C3VK98_9CYAN|nr:pyruvate kinase [Oscillatoriaceae cyanobacterium M33_DOE_052]
MRRTKIICTVGPASASRENLRALVEAGMNVARLNFSHNSHEFHAQTIQQIRDIAAETQKPIAIIQDLCGPKIRLGKLPSPIVVKPQDEITFVPQEEGNNSNEIPLPSSSVFAMVRKNEPIMIDDGRVKLIVIGREADKIRALVKIGGTLTSGKGVNLPETRLPLTSVTEKDLLDLRFGIKHGVDWVAISFVRSPLDLEPVQRMIEASGSKIRVIAKIEKREAVQSFDEILKIADGILIARGDMGVEMPIYEVPLIQKEIIRRCNRAGKPAITATQMLESMIKAPDPTRAEATDVANSILDGTDAVMLSGETAVGEYPTEAVQMMHNIAMRTERALPEGDQFLRTHATSLSVTESVASAVCRIASEIGAKVIVCSTFSGITARLVAKYRPHTPIIAFTPEESTYRQLALSWGVVPYLMPPARSTEHLLVNVVKTAGEINLVKEGDKIVISSGVPIGSPSSTSLIKVHTVGEPISAALEEIGE